VNPRALRGAALLGALVAWVALESRGGLYGVCWLAAGGLPRLLGLQLASLAIVGAVAFRATRGLTRACALGALLAVAVVLTEQTVAQAQADFYPLVVFILILCALLWRIEKGVSWGVDLVKIGLGAGLAFLAAGGLIGRWAGVNHAWMKNHHALVGILVVPFFLRYVNHHLATATRVWSPEGQFLGVLGTVVTGALLLTGLSRVGAGETLRAPSTSTELHGLFFWATAALLSAHVLSTLSGRMLPQLRRLFTPWTLAAAALPALLAAGALWRRPPTGERLLSGIEQEARNPRTGLTAATEAGGLLAFKAISQSSTPASCSDGLACHRAVGASTPQWESSAHRLAADPAYQLVVGQLAAEEGVAAVRLCASCHDPVPLLAGQMGQQLPAPGGEGVSCLVCHAMASGGPGAVGEGVYRLRPPAALLDAMSVRQTKIMVVYDDVKAHRAAALTPFATSPEACGSCHELHLNGVPLRTTYSEWRDGPFGPAGASPRSCSSCHMPPVRERAFGHFQPHDHSFRASNLMLAGPAGFDPARSVDFIRGALSLRASRVAPTGPGGPQVSVELTNKASGHGFPAGPMDLLDYWLEYRPGEGLGWVRLNDETLFPERLFDAAGNPLLRHEIWRVARHESPGRIPPGGRRSFAFPIPAAPAPAPEIRLMHRRLPGRLAADLAGRGLLLDPVEILRASLDPR
jgi:hypothetical protein